MWEVVNQTPFAADRGWTRDRDGMEIWLVAVKATFDIHPDGSTEVSREQPPVLEAPEYHGEPGKSSIKYEADLVPAKKTTDIIVVGHAQAPGACPVAELDAGFRVGPVQKMVKVFGDRSWGVLGPTSPMPFARMPLVYERAFGGVDPRSAAPQRDWDWRNPVGCGFAAQASNLAGTRLPNIELPNQLIRGPGDRPAPAGFGAIACHWKPRVDFGGTYDERWMKTRQPLLPEDFDDRFYQCAPADQQAPQFLLGGEAAAILNMSPLGVLRFVLPRLYLGFETHFYDGSRAVHQQRKLHTVILEPDFPRLSLVWHSAMPCHFKGHKLEQTFVTLKTNQSTGEPVHGSSDFVVA